ncbi:MAG: DUF1667 domain-containing protein [Treponema sp.]|nr:DUF1667 domain-containing protein [Treponema sp.]
MRNLTCIICPIGCSLEIQESGSGNLTVTGSRCPRGEVYAQEEIRSPKRIVTATAAVQEEQAALSVRRVPVKTSSACPKEKINALLCDIYKKKVSLPVKAGDVIISDWNGSGIDVIAARTISYAD